MGRRQKNVFIVVVVFLAVLFVVDKSINHQVEEKKMTQLSPRRKKPIVHSRSYKSECRESLTYNLKESGLDKIQKQRKSTVKEVCKMCKRNKSSEECSHVSLQDDSHFPEMYENLIVDEKHKVILCQIQKSGSSAWRKALWKSVSNIKPIMHLFHKPEVYSKVGLKPLSWFSNNERKLLLKTYFKFLVVRHPFERIVSCYRNKLEPSKKRETPLQIQLREENITLNTFSKFINHVKILYNENQKNVSKVRGMRYMNWHWAQYSTLCHPCHIDYDYIVKFETMKEDAAYVLSKLGPYDQCPEDKYPGLLGHSEPSSLRVYKQYLSQLTTGQMKKLREMYSIDFKLFGY